MLNSYIPFTVTLIDGKAYPVRDIFAFQNIFSAFLSNNNDYVMRYTVNSGDTPRSIAYYLYSSERYEWIIYCLNNIVNPYFEWPLSENQFYEMIETKYLDKKCLFLTMDSFTNNFKIGETISNGNGATATIDSWDRTYCKLTIKNTSGVFEENDTITSISSSGEIGRIVDLAEDAVHHFETSSGVQLDPYAGYLQAYISGINDIYAITNKQYEEKINDSKRSIYVLKPQYLRGTEALLLRNLNKNAQHDAENILK
jgi:hypothetical protein